LVLNPGGKRRIRMERVDLSPSRERHPPLQSGDCRTVCHGVQGGSRLAARRL